MKRNLFLSLTLFLRSEAFVIEKGREKNTERKTEREESLAMTSGKRESHEWALINVMKQIFHYPNS